MSMPKGDSFVVIFAAVVCLICSILLATAASSLKGAQDYNVELDRRLNIIKAFGVPVRGEDGKKIPSATIDQYFAENISEIWVDGASGEEVAKKEDAGEPLQLFVWREDGKITKYAFPISGKGLWSTIYGYMSLDADLSTIVGTTFYKHGETAGLGAEVEKDWFQNNWKGKKVFEDGKRLHFEVVKGRVSDKYPNGSDHAVDGISGATLTGNGVTRFVNSDLDKYEAYFKLHRGT